MTERERRNDDVIDLGAVIEETRGGGIVSLDTAGLEQPRFGLSDD